MKWSVGMMACLSAALWANPAGESQPAGASYEEVEWGKLQGAAASFVDAFNEQDAKTLAALFAENGVIELGQDVSIKGREAIHLYYQNIFESNPGAKIGMEATSVKFESPERVIERGALVMQNDDETSTFYYAAIVAKQDDGSWRIENSRTVQPAESSSNDALESIEGLIGEWVAQFDEASYKVQFRWDPSGAWMIGQGRFISPGIEPVRTTTRIGWDDKAGQIVSWSFDSLGGYSHSTWRRVEGVWNMDAAGVNADGESTKSLQTVSVVKPEQIVWSFTKREVDGAPQDDFNMRLVKSPPKPFANREGGEQ